MNQILKELRRLGIPIALLLLWVIIWGVKDSFYTASLLTGFIALSMILGHLVGKELFKKYNWDVGKKLNEAWASGAITDAILASAMLMARVLIYVAIMIAMAIVVLLLKGGL